VLPETNVTALALVSHPYIREDGEVVEQQSEVLITGAVEWNQDKLQYKIYDLDCTNDDGETIYVSESIACAKLMMRYFYLMRMV
jgi:hypothetical protein